MMKAVLQIAPLECAGCVKKLEDHLSQMNGVISVNVFPQLGKVRMEFDRIKVHVHQLEKTISTLGFQVLSLKN
ncbi:heavy-metal-associated domain-containing protein [Oceanobacillus sp. CF4.6]|uniref:heavy-metal-associated domain-containing protein n=1 Tax=Oceanobacillus sp. CF4.6 TaxID=3373080 RepID=UPI003EE54113